ncbi:hypothetical protein GGI43DRAFT_403204 [Trichoderma evansii]
MLNHILATKEAASRDPTSYQMQQWLAESDKEAPWTPLILDTPSTGHVAINSTIQFDLEDVLSSCAAQNSTNSGGNT